MSNDRPLADLRFFGHWGAAPENRGDANDAPNVNALRSVHITYGAWLYPDTVDEPHTVDIEFIGLEKSANR